MTRENMKSIMEMGRGAPMERIDYEMSKIIDNILDANTDPKAKRKLTVTVTLTPDDDRRTITIDYAVKSTLAPTNPVRTSLYIAGNDYNGEVSAVEMVPNIPGQMSIDSGTQELPAQLKVVKLDNKLDKFA